MNKRINGKKLASEILKDLKKEVLKLKKQKIIPHLAVIFIGNNQGSKDYIRQKELKAKKIGAQVSVYNFSKNECFQYIAEKVKKLNEDPNVHGVIIQRPLPALLNTGSVNRAVSLKKDVDGFKDKSPFDPPIGKAVMYILERVLKTDKVSTVLKNKKVLVIGRGETAGKPVAKTLSKNRIRFIIAHSKTSSIDEFSTEADVVISCVGKPNIIKPEHLKDGVILLGVGICRENGKLYGDFQESKIRAKASKYTPTPGGIGPLNVAFLMQNLVEACKKQNKIE